MRGELQKAEEFAKRAVQVARRGTTWIDHVAALTILASSLFHSGLGDKATRLFEEAEALQKKHERTQPFLHSSRGFRYHELLLDQERYDEVITRCERNLQRKPKNRISDAGPVDKGTARSTWFADLTAIVVYLENEHCELSRSLSGTGD